MKWLKLFIIICLFGLLLSCSSNIRSIATSTSQITKIPTQEATQLKETIPGLSVKLSKPDDQVLIFALNQFANAFQLTPEQSEKVKKGMQFVELKDKYGKTFVAAVTPDVPETKDFDETNIPLLIAEQGKNGEWEWRKSTLKDYGIPIGFGISYGDPNCNHSDYNETVDNEANFIVPMAEFRDPYHGTYGAEEHWVDVATKNGQTLRIQELFWHTDTPTFLEGAGQQAVTEYIQSRIRALLPFVIKGQTEIVLANEPFWEFKGKRGWQGEYGGNPLFTAFNKYWIAQGYVQLYNIAKNEFGLTPGVDFRIIGLIDQGSGLPGPRTNFMINQVNYTKQQIASQLGIPVESVQFDVGLGLHFGDQAQARTVTIPYSKVDGDKMKTNFISIQEKTGSRILISEMTEVGQEKDVALAYFNAIKAAKESGVIDSINFWQGLTWPRNPVWQNNLFDQSFNKSAVYYMVSAALMTTSGK